MLEESELDLYYSEMEATFKIKATHDRLDQFVKSLDSIFHILKESGAENQVLNDRAISFFNESEEILQIAAIARANRYLTLLQDIKSQGVSIDDTLGSLWRIFAKNGWLLESDLLSLINETDVVEIYLPDNTQLYRNSNFFKCTSYSISDLLVFPWSDLVEHGQKPSQEIFEIGKKIFVDQAPPGSKFKIEPYYAKERYSKRQYTARLESKFLSPIKSKLTRQNEAALVVWNIEVIDSAQKHNPLEMEPGL